MTEKRGPHKVLKRFGTEPAAGGSLSYDGTDLLQTAGVTANAVGTNGAGDMFAGAFLYAINAGHNYAWAAKFAKQPLPE